MNSVSPTTFRPRAVRDSRYVADTARLRALRTLSRDEFVIYTGWLPADVRALAQRERMDAARGEDARGGDAK